MHIQLNSTGDEDAEPELNCQLMDGFAVVVQVLLASIALGSLFIKRHRETPRRPLLIWAMDTSKQALAASMVHFVNVFVSSVAGIDAEGSKNGSTNPCVWYFLNLCMRLQICFRSPTPHQENMAIRQELFPFLGIFGKWVLSPLTAIGDPRFQIVVVMLIFPLIMNIVQAWLIDMVIKGDMHKFRRIRSSMDQTEAVAASLGTTGPESQSDWIIGDSTELLQDNDVVEHEEGLNVHENVAPAQLFTRMFRHPQTSYGYRRVQGQRGWIEWISTLFGRNQRGDENRRDFRARAPLSETNLVVYDDDEDTGLHESASASSIEPQMDCKPILGSHSD
ncbi:hypothetical protein BDEG_24136 [Batrachochytrium dendrobatidis JEL423]|uniref:Vacuolar membrane protein n=1 Tax=Batrachochytrium dendrobatidis (strain JEL423) TaxID=403673 RepID=A0A177WJZ1_BATDL|nr:hypothetical protein BDEG_24136 [Batrachochytrium dendrobatidis JEL423]